MRHVSLFTGIGGIDLAAEWAGFTTIAQVECDPYCLAVLAKHWPDVPRCDDIRNFPDQEYGAVTLVSGGFPCQPFSAAGKRRGRTDDRHLWPEMLRVIRAIKPSWVLAENVPGLLAIESGMAFETVLTDLEDAGYETWAGVIPAAGVGAPHFRYRVFVVGHAKSKRCGEERSDSGRSEKWVTSPSADVADTEKPRLAQRIPDRRGFKERIAGLKQGDWWAVEPDVGRVASRTPSRVDRLRCLGNAVVPQQVYPILKAIAEVEKR